MNYIQVQFANSARKYAYQDHTGSKVGDFVVVNTPSGGMQVVQVCDVDIDKPKFPCKLVVDKVDLTKYRELEDAEETNDANAVRGNKRLS